MRIKARLVNPPQRFKIGLLELPDAKRHAAIVAGEWRKSREEERRCQVSGVRCQVSGVRSQVPGFRCQENKLEPRSIFLTPDASFAN